MISQANLDYIGPQLTALGAVGVTVLGFLDSAYWIDVKPDADASPPSSFIGVGNMTAAAYALTNITGRAWPACKAKYPGSDEWKCALGQYRFLFLTTPYMTIASQDDAWHLSENVGHAPKSKEELAHSASFASATRSGFTTLAARASPAGSAFYSMACFSHSTSLSQLFWKASVIFWGVFDQLVPRAKFMAPTCCSPVKKQPEW